MLLAATDGGNQVALAPLNADNDKYVSSLLVIGGIGRMYALTSAALGGP